MIRRFLAVLGFVSLLSGVAAGQTYVRPSDGATIDLFTAVDYNGTTTDSTIYGMTGFKGVTFFVKTSAAGCTNLPVVTVFGSSSSTFSAASFDQATSAINGRYVARLGSASNTEDIYTVAPVSGFIKIRLSSVAAGGGTTCTATVKMIPVAFLPANPISASAVYSVKSVTTSPTSVITVSGASSVTAKRKISVQNQSTSVVFCGFDTNLTTGNYAVVLSACTAAVDGTGGSWTISDYAGPLYCTVATGTATISAYTY